MDMEKLHVKLKNGETYAYVKQGKGNRVLLLIHGNFSSSLHFTPLFKRLPKDITVYAPDLRGYGDSTYENRIQSLLELADDVKLFMDEMGVKKADILGWSLGGGVALEFAAKYPEMTDKLILVNSTTHKGYPIFRKNDKGQAIVGTAYASPEELGEDPVQVLPLLAAQKNKDFHTMSFIFGLTVYNVNKPSEDDLELWITESLKQKNLIDADWALANLNMSNKFNFYNNGTNNIQNVKAKVLHTWGTDDITVPEFMIFDNIHALENQSKYIKYERCGHSPFTDVPDQITKDILKFIEY